MFPGNLGETVPTVHLLNEQINDGPINIFLACRNREHSHHSTKTCPDHKNRSCGKNKIWSPTELKDECYRDPLILNEILNSPDLVHHP